MSDGTHRQLSFLRIVVALALLGALSYGAVVIWRNVTRATPALAPQWFAPYVDATLTPLYPFEDAAAVPTPQIVLGFIVGHNDGSCTPSWGSFYRLEEAATAIDLDRRLIRLREHGSDAIVSFGGAANTDLASVCSDASSLQAAYKSVIDRYELSTIDLDIEGPALDDIPALERRATALQALQKEKQASGKPISVWLTLPVDSEGLPPNAQTVVNTFLRGGVAVSGVNAMTMNFGGPGDKLRSSIERSLERVVGQVDAAYRDSGVTLKRSQLWRKVGATPMIGLNDTVSEQLDIDTANWLVEFARSRGVGRLSMWSLNRDTTCGQNIDGAKPSPHCSGVDQRPGAFSDVFSLIGRENTAFLPATGTPTATTAKVAVPAVRAPVVDDPTKSPYPIWDARRSYQQGRKVVWRGNVYVALWFTNGDPPDGARVAGSPVPWRLVGPLLPGEVAPTTTTLAPGTYEGWDPEAAYMKGQRVQVEGVGYEAKWWTRGDPPGIDVANDWDTPWTVLGADARR